MVTSVAGTTIDLVADSGATSGRIRIGGPSASQVFEVTVTDRGVLLAPDSLECVPAGVSACLVRGRSELGTAGQVVVGRSDKWSPLSRAFFSEAGYLGLVNVVADSAPEVVAVQRDCAPGADCARAPVYAQVFGLGGDEVGCTRAYPRVEQLPGYPRISPTAAQLRPCP